MRVSVNQQNLPQYFENKSGLVNNIKRAEIKLVGFLATNNSPFTLMDILFISRLGNIKSHSY